MCFIAFSWMYFIAPPLVLLDLLTSVMGQKRVIFLGMHTQLCACKKLELIGENYKKIKISSTFLFYTVLLNTTNLYL